MSWGLYILLEHLTLINSEHDCTANQRTPDNEVEPRTPRSGISGADTALYLQRGFSLSTVDGGRRAGLLKT